MPPARIGIVGCDSIAGKNRRAIVASGNIVAAVASRTLSKAQAWAAEAVASGDVPDLPIAYGSYEALLSDRTIDAIYMPLPCGTHVEWVLAAAAAGKGVLVEKPAAVSVDALERMITACADARVPLMDGARPLACSLGEGWGQRSLTAPPPLKAQCFIITRGCR